MKPRKAVPEVIDDGEHAIVVGAYRKWGQALMADDVNPEGAAKLRAEIVELLAGLDGRKLADCLHTSYLRSAGYLPAIPRSERRGVGEPSPAACRASMAPRPVVDRP